MAQTLLTFELNKEKDAAVLAVCRQLGIHKIDVAKKDYAQTLGFLVKVKGFPREKAVYTGSAFPAEMLVFSGMNSDQVDAFLAEYRRSGLPAIGLKAIVTAHNVFWTPEALFRELMKEHLAFPQGTPH